MSLILQGPLWRDLLVCKATQSTCVQKSQALGTGLALVRPRLCVLGLSSGSSSAWRVADWWAGLSGVV